MRLLTGVYCVYGRLVVAVEKDSGERMAFYRRTGGGGWHARGAQPGDWVPFLGCMDDGFFIKHEFCSGLEDSPLLRWGTDENRAVGEWLRGRATTAPIESTHCEINRVLWALRCRLDLVAYREMPE